MDNCSSRHLLEMSKLETWKESHGEDTGPKYARCNSSLFSSKTVLFCTVVQFSSRYLPSYTPNNPSLNLKDVTYPSSTSQMHPALRSVKSQPKNFPTKVSVKSSQIKSLNPKQIARSFALSLVFHRLVWEVQYVCRSQKCQECFRKNDEMIRSNYSRSGDTSPTPIFFDTHTTLTPFDAFRIVVCMSLE